MTKAKLCQQMVLGKHMNRSAILLDLFPLMGTKLAALIFTGTEKRIAKKFCTGIPCAQKRATSGAGWLLSPIKILMGITPSDRELKSATNILEKVKRDREELNKLQTI